MKTLIMTILMIASLSAFAQENASCQVVVQACSIEGADRFGSVADDEFYPAAAVKNPGDCTVTVKKGQLKKVNDKVAGTIERCEVVQ